MLQLSIWKRRGIVWKTNALKKINISKKQTEMLGAFLSVFLYDAQKRYIKIQQELKYRKTKQEGFGKKLFWEGISLVFLYVRCEEIAIYS